MWLQRSGPLLVAASIVITTDCLRKRWDSPQVNWRAVVWATSHVPGRLGSMLLVS